jgi:hypothetical protein
MRSDAAIHIALWHCGVKAKSSSALAEIDKSPQKSTEVDKYHPKINQSRQKSTKVISCQQKSTLFQQE